MTEFSDFSTIGSTDIASYEALKDGEQFIIDYGAFKFFAVKINNEVAALINSDGKFILAKKFKNIISIGNYSSEYNSLSEAVTNINGWEMNVKNEKKWGIIK